MKRQNIESQFRHASLALNEQLNRDPAASIRSARRLLASQELDETNRQILAANTLIDGGALCRDPQAVEEGIALLEHLTAKNSGTGGIEYCLANGLLARAEQVVVPTAEWLQVTAADRRRAKKLFQSVADDDRNPADIISRALTNLGNMLARSHRSTEAYDSYSRAIAKDPTNGVALTGAARVLGELARNGFGEPDALGEVAAEHLRSARKYSHRIQELAGQQAFENLTGYLDDNLPKGELPDLSAASEYQRFVAQHRLALAPTIEGLDLTLARWDMLRLGSIQESLAESGVPPIFAMFNMLKAEFLAARYAAFIALKQSCPESGKYYDTLDYACYSTSVAMLALAQKSCFDLLDKIAVATCAYLGLPGKPSSITFTTQWFQKQKAPGPRILKPEIVQLIRDGNFPLIALVELAADLIDDGFLNFKQTIRHASTHRFVVLHDIGTTPSRESPYIEHYSLERFERNLIETLQLARATFSYFVHMVTVHERSKQGGGIIATMEVPDHDPIRGDDH